MLARFIPLFWLGLIKCSSIDSIASIIVSEFISNLNSEDLGEPFPVLKSIPKVISIQNDSKENCSSPISVLPSQMLNLIFEYLGHRDSFLFIEVSKAFNFAGKTVIRNRLLHFSPRFLFNLDWLNHLVYSELANYFTYDPQINRANKHDQYEMACITGRKDKSEIRALRIRYLIQAFIHESLYGSDCPISQNEYQWKLFLLLKLSDKSINLCTSLSHYIQINKDIIDSEYNNPIDRAKLYAYLDLFVDLMVSGPLTYERFCVFEYQKSFLELKPVHLQVSFEKEVQLLIQLIFLLIYLLFLENL